MEEERDAVEVREEEEAAAAEELLEEEATHAGDFGDPLRDAGRVEEEEDPGAHGEADDVRPPD